MHIHASYFSQTPGVDLHTKVVNIPETNDSVVRFCASASLFVD